VGLTFSTLYYFLPHSIFYLYIHYVRFVIDKKPPLNLLFFAIKMLRPNENQVKTQTRPTGNQTLAKTVWYKTVRTLGLKPRIADE
jgi:hypothetical protein